MRKQLVVQGPLGDDALLFTAVTESYKSGSMKPVSQYTCLVRLEAPWAELSPCPPLLSLNGAGATGWGQQTPV